MPDDPPAPASPLPPLTEGQVREVLASPGGSFALLEMVRAGRIDAESAVVAIERHDREPFLRRLGYAILDTLFSM